jgi:hypothetical protein
MRHIATLERSFKTLQLTLGEIILKRFWERIPFLLAILLIPLMGYRYKAFCGKMRDYGYVLPPEFVTIHRKYGI